LRLSGSPPERLHLLPRVPACRPEENCVLQSEYVEDNITTNGVERHLTMANVHISDSLGYANELLVIGPFGSFDGSNITFSQDPQSTANSDGSPCVEVNACDSLALARLPLIFSCKFEKSLCGTGRSPGRHTSTARTASSRTAAALGRAAGSLSAQTAG
jgi:hypothetical protein